MQATTRSSSQKDWVEKNSDFKFQIIIDEKDTYISSYWDMDNEKMANGLWRGYHNRISRSVWNFKDAAQSQFDENSAFNEA